MNEVEEYYLQHFGVKGMKWGVRKNRSGGGRIKNRIKREVGSFQRERSQLKVKDPSKMTDSELKKTLNRNRLENQFKDEVKKTNKIGNRRDQEGLDRKSANRDAYLDRGSLSDKQLKAKVERIRSENQLVQEANKINRKSLEVGKSFVSGVSSSVLKDVMTSKEFNTGQIVTRALMSGSIDATRTYFKESGA